MAVTTPPLSFVEPLTTEVTLKDGEGLPMVFQFMRLPREIRDRIYDSVIAPSHQPPSSLDDAGGRWKATRCFMIKILIPISEIGSWAYKWLVTSSVSAIKSIIYV